MLSLFPQILFLSPFAALLIRIILALFLALAAWRHLSRSDMGSRIRSVIEVALAVPIFVGAWTQAVALLGLILVGITLFMPKLRAYPLSTLILGCVLFATLVVTGAGAYAFDLAL